MSNPSVGVFETPLSPLSRALHRQEISSLTRRGRWLRRRIRRESASDLDKSNSTAFYRWRIVSILIAADRCPGINVPALADRDDNEEHAHDAMQKLRITGASFFSEGTDGACRKR